MTVNDALDEAAQSISRRDAETLLLQLLQRDRAWLYLHATGALTTEQHTRFAERTARRAAREPLQYITGVQEFFGLPLRVTPATLIPRPETEHLVEAVLAWAGSLSHTPAILDAGTGTGAIVLALATHLPKATFAACDLSLEALEVARENAATLGLGDRIAFAQSDLLADYANTRFDAIVSNPPYIPAGDAAEMQPEVCEFEPHTALFAGDDGLEVYRRLIPQAQAALRPGGLLAMEFGFGQRAALAEMLAEWKNVRFIDDYAGIPRVVLADSPRANTL